MDLKNFLMTNIWGILIIGAMGSILGSLLIYLSNKFLKFLFKRYENTNKWIRKLISRISYKRGYMFGRAHYSSYKQIIIIGKVLMELIIGVTMLLVILLLCITIILISDSINYSLFSFLTGVVLAIPFYKIFWVLKDFEFLIDKFFFKKKKEEKDSDIEINSSDENSEEDEFLISMMKMTAQKFKAKEYQSTILYSTKVLELYQSNEFFFALRGFAKIKTKEYQGALEDLKEALKLNPNKKEYQEQIDSLNEKLTEKKELPPTKHTRQ